MLARMRTRTTGGLSEISLIFPSSGLGQVSEAVKGALKSNGLKVRRVNEDGEELFSVKEVFPEAHPGMVLRGLRGKEGLTQAEMAERLGLKQHRISEMESGKHPISLALAKRIGQEFQMSYKIFL